MSRCGRVNPGSTPGVVIVRLVEGLENVVHTNSHCAPVLAKEASSPRRSTLLLLRILGQSAKREAASSHLQHGEGGSWGGGIPEKNPTGDVGVGGQQWEGGGGRAGGGGVFELFRTSARLCLEPKPSARVQPTRASPQRPSLLLHRLHCCCCLARSRCRKAGRLAACSARRSCVCVCVCVCACVCV